MTYDFKDSRGKLKLIWKLHIATIFVSMELIPHLQVINIKNTQSTNRDPQKWESTSFLIWGFTQVHLLNLICKLSISYHVVTCMTHYLCMFLIKKLWYTVNICGSNNGTSTKLPLYLYFIECSKSISEKVIKYLLVFILW